MLIASPSFGNNGTSIPTTGLTVAATPGGGGGPEAGPSRPAAVGGLGSLTQLDASYIRRAITGQLRTA